MTNTITIDCDFHVLRRERGRHEIQRGPAPTPPAHRGRVPRIARLMALAIRFDQLVRTGEVRDYADLARLGHVSRVRITQIMNLLLLAPDIQEEILFLPNIEQGRERIFIRQLQPLAATCDWTSQRAMWKGLCRARGIV